MVVYEFQSVFNSQFSGENGFLIEMFRDMEMLRDFLWVAAHGSQNLFSQWSFGGDGLLIDMIRGTLKLEGLWQGTFVVGCVYHTMVDIAELRRVVVLFCVVVPLNM